MPEDQLPVTSSISQRRLFITQKYKEGRFKKILSPNLSLQQLNEVRKCQNKTEHIAVTLFAAHLQTFSKLHRFMTSSCLCFAVPPVGVGVICPQVHTNRFIQEVSAKSNKDVQSVIYHNV